MLYGTRTRYTCIEELNPKISFNINANVNTMPTSTLIKH